MLIADGDAELCDHYRNFATEHGYEVVTSSDGLDCVRKLCPGDARCVVLANNGRDADVKAWAEKCLPILREHLKLAQAAVEDVKKK